MFDHLFVPPGRDVLEVVIRVEIIVIVTSDHYIAVNDAVIRP